MFIYIGKRFDSAQSGGRIVGVACDRCRCEYYYELRRTGIGASEAPYMIATGAASRAAEEKAQRDLQQRLMLEADLVPCPQCNWINDELVQGYRLGRYRGLGLFALLVAILGTVTSLLVALVWSANMRTGFDRAALPYFLYGGPVLFLSFSAAIILFRRWLRSLIRPNRNYPQPPQVPPGSPRALLKDKHGQLQLADPFDVADGVDFGVDRHQLPLMCCTCIGDADPKSAYELPMQEPFNLKIPRCARCARKARGKFWPIFFLLASAGLVVGIGSILLLGEELISLQILIGFALLAYVGFVYVAAAALLSPVKIVAGERPPSVVRLRFRNADYARAVAKNNTNLALEKGISIVPGETKFTKPLGLVLLVEGR